jgi:ketosteroid isomerase-like protein
MTRAPRPFRRQQSWIAAILCSILLSAAFPFAGFAKGPKTNKKPDYKRQVEQLEELWRIAELNADTGQMDKLLSDDYVGISMNGQIVTKTQQLARMRSRQLVITKIDLNDVKVKLIGSAAIVTSQAQVEGTNDGTPMHGTYRYTRVYTRLPSGAWKITNFEATRVGPHHKEHDAERAQGSAPTSD